MKTIAVVRLLLTVLLVLSGCSAAPEATDRPAENSPPVESSLRVVQSSDQDIVLELTVTDFHIQMAEDEGQTVHQLIISGMARTARPGKPEFPTYGTVLGLPSATGVSVQVLDATYETLQGDHLLPTSKPQLPADTLDNLLEGAAQPMVALEQNPPPADAPLPRPLVEIGQTGYIRDQAVAQVQFYPVQYNSISGELRLYRRIRARVTWDMSHSVATLQALRATPEALRAASPIYEHILHNLLLNSDALRQPSGASQAPPVGTTQSERAQNSTATPALKIGVTEDGLYVLTYTDLTAAGFDLRSIDPRTIKITHRGSEIPIYVQGESDGVFDPTDVILFYGTAFSDIYTSTNVYWLTAGGAAGQRMPTRDGTLVGSAPVPLQFPVTLHAEEDTYYWQTIPDGAGQDHWFWDDKLSAPEERVYPVTLHNISTSANTARVRVRLKGRTDTPTINPDHHTRLSLNGIKIDEQWWDGQSIHDHEVLVPHAYLHEGSNTLTVEAVGDTKAAVDQAFVNWIEIAYWGTYVAADDALFFSAPTAGTFQFAVAGFRSGDVEVFDVTDPAHVVRITNPTIVNTGRAYTVQFTQTVQPDTRYLALTRAQHKRPASLELDEPSSWKSTSNGADYIIITHEEFYQSALRLAAYRSASGLRVATVKVEDIYDEFNYGLFHPQAIRDFLAYAYQNWVAPAPTYVVLLGDATQDYKDNLMTGTVNYVPSQVIETEFWGEMPSDNWFVLVRGDDILPDMLIGRLPAQTVSEAEAMVDKVIQYEQTPPDNSWNKNVLLVADDAEEPWETVFETDSEALASLLPQGYMANRVYAGHYPPGDPTTDITNYINRGSLLVNYSGHGNVEVWGLWNGSKHIFDRSNVIALANADKLPVVTVADCLSGFFTGPKTQVSMAEEFLRQQRKGAVAVWAPTSLGFADDHQLLMGEFYKAIFQGGQSILGAATTTAKLKAYAQSSLVGELVETYVLFGDPALRLGKPPASFAQVQ